MLGGGGGLGLSIKVKGWDQADAGLVDTSEGLGGPGQPRPLDKGEGLGGQVGRACWTTLFGKPKSLQSELVSWVLKSS